MSELRIDDVSHAAAMIQIGKQEGEMRRPVFTAALVLLTAPAVAQERWDELECAVLAKTMAAIETSRQNWRARSKVVELAIRGSDYSFYEQHVEPKLEPIPEPDVGSTMR